jgi:hypothetical protein
LSDPVEESMAHPMTPPAMALPTVIASTPE